MLYPFSIATFFLFKVVDNSSARVAMRNSTSWKVISQTLTELDGFTSTSIILGDPAADFLVAHILN